MGGDCRKLECPAILAKDTNQLRHNDPSGADRYGNFKHFDHWLSPPTIRPQSQVLDSPPPRVSGFAAILT